MEELFKAYAIRGNYPNEITEDFAYKLGRAVAAYFADEEIVIGRDVRIGSDKLADALMKGIVDQGSTALNIGVCSTAVVQLAAQEYPAVMVTAAQDLKEYNGFVIYLKGGVLLSLPDGLGAIKQLMEQKKWQKPKRKGKISRRDFASKYVALTRESKGKLKSLKIVVDAGNGVAGLIVPKLFARLPVKVVPLFFDPDGNFPNRPPNPFKPGALDALSKAVRQHKAHLGVAYDGDADRVLFVDERGIFVRADCILALLAQQALKEHPHAKILYDLRSSRVVKERVTDLGGVAIMTRVGYSYVTQVLKDEDALLAGELNGQYYFKDFFFSQNADIAVFLLLNLLSSERKPLSSIVKPLQRYAGSNEISFVAKDTSKILKDIEDEYAEKGGKVYTIDGLSVEFPDWWFNLRPSHSEPYLRLNVEAKTKALLDRKIAELKRLLT